MSEIPIEIKFISGLIVIALLFNAAVLAEGVLARTHLSKRLPKTSGSLGRGVIHPKQYPNFLFAAKNIFGLFGFNHKLVILFNKRTDRG